MLAEVTDPDYQGESGMLHREASRTMSRAQEILGRALVPPCPVVKARGSTATKNTATPKNDSTVENSDPSGTKAWVTSQQVLAEGKGNKEWVLEGTSQMSTMAS